MTARLHVHILWMAFILMITSGGWYKLAITIGFVLIAFSAIAAAKKHYRQAAMRAAVEQLRMASR